MDCTTVAVSRTVALAPWELFALFGTSQGAGWLFGARCDEVRSGAAVSMRLPLDEHGGHTVEILGRLGSVVPDAAIDIEHTQPWRGRIGLRFAPDGAHGTRVQVRARVPRAGVEWLLHRRGLPLPEPLDDGAVRLGAITTASGPGAVYSMSAELMAELAVTEINAEGGVRGRPVQPHRRRRRDRRRPGRGRGRPHGAAGLPGGLRQQHLRLLRGGPATARGPRGPRRAHGDQRGRGRRPHRRPVRGAPVAPSSTPSWAPPWPTGRGAGSSSGRATSGRTGPTERRGGRSTGPAGRWWARRSHPWGPATSGT